MVLLNVCLYSLIRLRRQVLCLQIPLDHENGRAFRAQCQEPLPVLDNHAFGLREVERSVGSGPIADQERKSHVSATLLPFAVRPVEAW
jgi:hypothetical protein